MGNKVIAENKIGRNKGRPRIWLDGKRLTDAGFTGGKSYYCDTREGAIICVIPNLICDKDGNALPTSTLGVERKVTGRPDGKPIIDILGKTVEAAFGEGVALPERVTVTYELGRIVITRAA